MLSAVTYLADADVDTQTDRQLRELLHLCFGEAFKDKRYYFEMPPHRWFIWDGETIAAHLAVHEKVLYGNDIEESFIGVAEVCVAPSYRGRGLVRTMLKEAEGFFPDIKFSVLLGDPGVYGSSGYRPAGNVYLPYKSETVSENDVLVKALRGDPWPKGKLVIHGPPF